MNFLDPRLPDRFWSKCAPEPNSGCWLWFANASVDGYGQFCWNGRNRPAHRLAFETLVRKIPVRQPSDQERLVLDHLCRTPCCVNPAHLELVPEHVNLSRGMSPSAINARRTSCVNGHAFDDRNTHTYVYRGAAMRICRKCDVDKQRRYKERKMAARNAAVRKGS